MKKTLLTFAAVVGLSLWARAVEYVDWVDWNAIEHWAGDPDGANKCALVIDFQDEYGNQALVWGYRWNGTATGEDLVRAVAGQSSVLTAMIQYTGTMGSTLNGFGISANRENLDYLHYDFERAAIAGEVSFGYFDINTTMGQETAPGYAAADMCATAIGRAKSTGIIEHPLNAFVYGYPAYDYDYWKMEEGYESYDYRWRSGWYDGYWSYWHGPNDYDYMSYSGLGMSSIVLTDGSVQCWKWTPLTGSGFGSAGGELAKELDYQLTFYDERMHGIDEVVQPVNQDKVKFWVGEGEKSATVVFQFNDGRGPENLVYGYRWTGGWDDDLATVIDNIAVADPRMTVSKTGDNVSITYDSNDNGVLDSTYDHISVEKTWNFYVKRVVDDSFNKVPGGRWLNPNAVLIVSHQDADIAEVGLPYLLFRPSVNTETIITLPEVIDYALDDAGIAVPFFIELPEGAKISTGFTWTRDANITAVTNSMTTSCFVGKVSSYKNFKPVSGEVFVRGSYTPAGATKAEYTYSNPTLLNLMPPVRPVTAIRYEATDVAGRLAHPVENRLFIEPADATYTKINYKSGNTKVATVAANTGLVTTTKVAGETSITATYDLDAEITSSFALTSSLVSPVEDITFECADENNVIELTPKEMAGLFPVFTPSDPDITDVTVKLSGNGTGREDYTATMYQVNIWDENNTRTRPYELSGHRVGESTLTVESQDGSGFKKEFTVRVVEPEREPVIDYTTGTIMLNEEWFGHTNGGLNWFSPEYDIVYQAYERENPGMSFGCTSQYGIVYDGKLIVCSKQAVDGGDPLPGGGRLVIADASTLKRIGSIDDLKWGTENKSNDGRACAGAGHGRVYVGTNSGIYIVDIEKCEISGKVGESTLEGDANGKPNTDPSSSLYSGQMGDMVLAGHYVFAIRQSTGVYVIDIDTDQIVKFIPDTQVQGITQSADGRVWYATIDSDKLSNFVGLDINTLEESKRVVVPAEIGTVSCGWGAWRTTQFTGAHSVNSLFFSPGSSISNGGTGVIHRYDIDTDSFTALTKISGLPAHTPGKVQGAYGTIRYDDRTGEIIAGTTESQASGHYRWNWTHFIDATTGEIARSVELRPYYWFQAHAIFPDACDPEIEEIGEVFVDVNDGPTEVTLNVTDRDNNDNNIRLSLIEAPIPVNLAKANTPAAEVSLAGNVLTVKGVTVGRHTVGIAVESNGRRVNHAVDIIVNDRTDVENVFTETASLSAKGNAIVARGCAGVTFDVVNIDGSVVDTFTADSDCCVHVAALQKGVYIVVGDNGLTNKVILK